MSSPGGGQDIQATLGIISQAADLMESANTALQAFGAAIQEGASQAAGGAGDGPLAGALSTMAADGQERATERGRECAELAEALHESGRNYRNFDGLIEQQYKSIKFGGIG